MQREPFIEPCPRRRSRAGPDRCRTGPFASGWDDKTNFSGRTRWRVQRRDRDDCRLLSKSEEPGAASWPPHFGCPSTNSVVTRGAPLCPSIPTNAPATPTRCRPTPGPQQGAAAEEVVKMAGDSFKRTGPIAQDPQAIAEWKADADKLLKTGKKERLIGGVVAAAGAVVLGTAFLGGAMLLGPLTLIGGFVLLAVAARPWPVVSRTS